MRKLALFFAVAGLAVMQIALAQVVPKNGTVEPGDTAIGIVGRFSGVWGSGPPYECSAPAWPSPSPSPSHGQPPLPTAYFPPPPNTFVVTAVSGECQGRQLTTTFRVASQTAPTDQIKVQKRFEYTVSCNTGTDQLEHDLAFCNPPGPCAGGDVQNIDEGSFVFNLGGPGSDVIAISTTEGPTPPLSITSTVPALGPWGIAFTGLAVVALAVFLILRRSSTAPA
jgi:hypothetical protein